MRIGCEKNFDRTVYLSESGAATMIRSKFVGALTTGAGLMFYAQTHKAFHAHSAESIENKLCPFSFAVSLSFAL
jgi:hypothetical protein